jgi:hypothetical protein
LICCIESPGKAQSRFARKPPVTIFNSSQAMSTTQIRSNSTSPAAELLILVHGTFAASESGEGNGWWQNGSAVSDELMRRLPDQVCLPENHEVFHWSGENSERGRIKAGRQLLSYLESLEAEGCGYHLIGHSHGGSVIWHALQLATSQGKLLDNLRSWATVGTPYLQHRTRGFLTAVNVFNLLLAIALIKPALTTFRALTQIVFASILGAESPAVASATGKPITISFWKTPVLRTAEMLGIHVATTEHGFQIGSYDSASGEPLGTFLLTSPEGWMLFALALVVVYVYLNLGGLFLGPVLEAYQHRGERKLRNLTMSRYVSSWLGIWSRDDEAINGLRSTLSLSVSFVARMAPRERVLLSDHLSLLSRPYHWVLSPIFNYFLRPLLDGLVRSFVVKTAQGNNRPATEVVDVSPTPIATEPSVAWSPIPAWLDDKIVEQANSYASDVAPKLRRLIAAPSFTAGLETFGNAVSGHEMVHTSYFDHAEILDLLAMHIGRARADAFWKNYGVQHNADLIRWLKSFHNGSSSAKQCISGTASFIRPRRRVEGNKAA